ncbi:MAG: efflux RND transporter periplasmic adaptor subunit [Ahrensia sp.]
MKANRYVAILVFIASAIWVLTGDFSSVGGAVAQDTQPATLEESTDPAQSEAEQNADIQRIGFVVIPKIEHARSVRISGTTQADKTTAVTARENGVVADIAVKQGDAVKKGDLILTLDPEGREATLASAQQLVEQRRADTEARRALVERGTLPKLQLDQTISALRQAESDLAKIEAEMERLTVFAPFDGIINVLDVEVGSAVQPGATVATLIALDPIIGLGEVNEGDLPIVSVGNAAQLRLVNGAIVDGTIRYISRQADPVTRTYTVEVDVPNPDLSIPSGMTTEVILRGNAVSATPVPRSIITLNDAGELGVRAVDADNKVVFYPIDIVDDGTDALILAGIPEGARIVVLGQNIISEGQTVDPVEADEEAINRLIAEAGGVEGTQ